MRLATRLLLGALVLIVVLVVSVVAIAGSRLSDHLLETMQRELERDARLVGLSWRPGVDADSLADAAGAATGRRVTIIDSTGVVIGDSEFDGEDLHHLQNHSTRPEVIAAKRTGVGSSMRSSVSAGDNEVYVAVRQARGVIRVSVSTARFDEIVAGARRDVLIAGLIALVGALAIGFAFSRSVSRPITELRDVAWAIAGGELDRRPALSGSGEVGDLSRAVQRMTEQLASRLSALESDDELLTAVIDSLDEGIVAVNALGEVVRLNEAARRLLALTAQPPFSLDLLPQDRPVREAVRATMRGIATESAELTYGERTLLLTTRPLPHGGAVLAVMDLTTQRRLETIRRDFVANVSHELKTPLTVIGGFADTLGGHDLDAADRQRFLDTITSNTRRMQRIVDDLLDLSRYESGSWRPSVQSNDVSGIVTDVFTGVQRAADPKGLALQFDAPEDARRIDADPTALRQVLANLVENAVRHTARGGVTVRTRRTDRGVALAVIDTGSGIAPEHLGRIFERFYRVDAGRSRQEGGTGLGLAIVKHLVEAHGGTVRAESALGVGTTITAEFPRSGVDERMSEISA